MKTFNNMKPSKIVPFMQNPFGPIENKSTYFYYFDDKFNDENMPRSEEYTAALVRKEASSAEEFESKFNKPAKVKPITDVIKQSLNYVSDYYGSEGYKERAGKTILTDGQPLSQETPIPRATVGFMDYPVAGSYALSDKSFLAMGVAPSKFFGASETAAHEMAHLNMLFNDINGTVGTGDRASDHYGIDYTLLPQHYVDILTPTQQTSSHNLELNENYSDHIATKQGLYETGIFDSRLPGQTFTQEQLNAYKQTERGKKDRFLQLHSDDQVIRAINEIAYNKSTPFQKNDNVYFAKNGSKFVKVRNFIKYK